MNRIANVPTDRESTLLNIPRFEQALKIEVFSAPLNKEIVYGGSEDYTKRLTLYLVKERPDAIQNHFHAIVNLQAFFGSNYFCPHCRKAYNNVNSHSCKATCIVCQSRNCEVDERTQKLCTDCNLQCRSAKCFKRHKTDQKYTKGKRRGQIKAPANCSKVWKCPRCYHVLSRSKRDITLHTCGEYQCSSCQQYIPHDQEHMCFVRMKEPKVTNGQFLFADFETVQSSGTHVVNYAVCQSSCDNCHRKELGPLSVCRECGSRCEKCGKRDKETQKFDCPPCEEGTCGRRERIFFWPNDTL